MSETQDARTNTEQRDMDTDSVETEQKAARTSDDERLTTADLVREADDVDKSSTGDTDQAEERQPLFAGDEAEGFRGRWTEIQTGFVDEPRRAVEDADALVAEVMQRLAETFSTERATLEQQWDGDGEPSTEDLRVGLQRYRSFFDRLLSA
ncbi:MAG: hypothetical protein WKF41_00880 [Gaiellaceae bacterium]